LCQESTPSRDGRLGNQLNHGQQIADRDLCIELLFNLTLQDQLRCLSLLNLSTGKFPAIFELTIASLGDEDSVSIWYDCGYDTYCIHQ
jgi:hypothetical protein